MDNENREKIKKIFFNILGNTQDNNFNFNKDRSEFEDWDSLNHMQLISEVEDVFGLSFEMDQIVGINKPEDLVVLIDMKQNG